MTSPCRSYALMITIRCMDHLLQAMNDKMDGMEVLFPKGGLLIVSARPRFSIASCTTLHNASRSSFSCAPSIRTHIIPPKKKRPTRLCHPSLLFFFHTTMDSLSVWIRRQLLSVTNTTSDHADKVATTTTTTTTVNPRDQLLHTHRRRQDRPFRRTSVQLALPDVAVS